MRNIKSIIVACMLVAFSFVLFVSCATVESGRNGKSAYEMAVENGFVGTEAEWLESLKGDDGKDGTNGKAGVDGKDGADGKDGVNGQDGKSAYEIAVENGFVGTETEWLESLKGSDGKDGSTIEDKTCIVYYYDGDDLLGSELVVKGGYASRFYLGNDKEGYEKIWVDQSGNAVDNKSKISEDVKLIMKYKPYGRAEIYSQEVLSLIKVPAKVNFDPDIKYYQNYKFFAMQASIEVTQKGRLWSCWIGGQDAPGAYLIATYSDDGGENWKDIQFVIDPHDNDLPLVMNTHIGCFWQDPLGRLWLFYQQSFGMWDGEGANFAIVCDDPDAEHPIWSEPKYISVGASLKKPIVTSKGEWLLPVSIWERWHIGAPLQDEHHGLDGMRGAYVYASVDRGQSWQYRGGVIFTDSQFNEHSIAELSDGRIMMYSRCSNAIKKAYSSDGGRTWTEEEVAFPHIGSLAMIRTLPSGNLLLIKHGSNFTSATTYRSHLKAYVSQDDGVTWKGGLLIDERNAVSYPDIAIGADGTVYVQYDYNRNTDAQILFARFTEQEAAAGQFMLAGSGTKKIIKDTQGIKGHFVDLYSGAEAFAGGDGSQTAPYIVKSAGNLKYLAEQVSKGITYDGVYFKQTDDIDFGGANIQPIGYWLQGGSHKLPFRGNYDGDDHVISGFTQIAPELCSRGVFGWMTAGSLKNIRIENAEIEGMTNIGAFVGLIDGSAGNPITIENCIVGDNVTVKAYAQVGGIIGRCVGYVTIKDCVNNANVAVPYSIEAQEVLVGGIVGYIDNNITILNCVNNGDLYVRHVMTAQIGGISSNGKNCVISGCVNNGNIVADCCVGHINVGGIAGWNSSVQISNCSNRGKITASGLSSMNIGGLVGFYGKIDSEYNKIENSYNIGDISVKAFSKDSVAINIGGIVALASCKNTDNSSITGCVFAGSIIADTDGAVIASGSFIGHYNATTMKFANNFACGERAVGKSNSADAQYVCCVINDDIARQKLAELQAVEQQ